LPRAGSRPTIARMEREQSTPRRSTSFHLCVGFVVVAVAWAVSAFVLRSLAPDLQARGLIGDSFGAINALFSGLALAGVVYAILQQNEARDQQARALDLQMEALRIQQAELRAQLNEMEAARGEMKRQTDAIEAQRRATLCGALIAGGTALYNATMDDVHGAPATAERAAARDELKLWTEFAKKERERCEVAP
jgi:hypothetical protein